MKQSPLGFGEGGKGFSGIQHCIGPLFHHIVLSEVPALQAFVKLSLLPKLKDLNKQNPNQKHNQKKKPNKQNNDEGGS